MNVQQRLDALMAHENVTVAGVKKQVTLSHLSAVHAEVEYVWIVSDSEQRIMKCEMIVYNQGEANETAYYLRREPDLEGRDTYHTDEQVKTHIETEYTGAEVIRITQDVRKELDFIDVEAKWTDGFFYMLRFIAWGPSQFAQTKITQV